MKKQSIMTSLCEENSVEENIKQKPFAVHVQQINRPGVSVKKILTKDKNTETSENLRNLGKVEPTSLRSHYVYLKTLYSA